MADWWLIFVTVITFVILLVIGLYLLVYYSHPDDKNDAYLPKLTVLLGFVIACATVLLLPLDVANREGYPGCDGYDTQLCGGLNMNLFWDIFYWLIPVWVFILIPFMTFYYEADDGMLMAGTAIGAKPNSRICEAMKYEVAVLIIVGVIFALCYIFLSDTDIPVRDFTGPTIDQAIANGALFSIQPGTSGPNGEFQIGQLASFPQAGDTYVQDANERSSDMSSLTLQVNVPTFFAGFMAFVGWFFFALFGGVGIAAMPLDLILTFVNRPRHMDAAEFAEAQISIRERVNELVYIGELLKIEREERKQAIENGSGGGGWFNRERRKADAEERKTFLQFKQAVYLLEKDVEDFQNCSANYQNYNPLIPYVSLFCGVCSVIISIIWILQIILYILPPNNPITPFLNNYFEWFDNWFPLFGVLSVALFSIYLLLSAVKGCFKFGLRFLFFQIHPMKVNRTYMSSFMFNIALVLLCALPVVQFCTTAFSDYARYTTVYQVFGTQIQYLKFFKYFWMNNVFVYALLVIAVLTSLYLWCKPSDKSATSSIELRDRLKSRRG